MKALRIKETGELFRLAPVDPWELRSLREGMYLPVYNTCLTKRRKRSSKVQYDKIVEIAHYSHLHEIVNVKEEQLSHWERQRLGELLCLRAHPEKVRKLPYSNGDKRKEASNLKDPENIWKELVRLSGEALRYLIYPNTLTPTQLVALKFDLGNVLEIARKRDGGLNAETKGGAAPGRTAQNP